MGTSGSDPDITREDTWSVFSQLDEPCTPLTTSEVAEKQDCNERTAQHNLEALAELGALQTKQIDGQSTIWWRAGDGSEPAGQQSEVEAFNALVNAVEDYAIFMLNPHGEIISWNAGAERIKGYTESDIVGKHFSTFYTDADIDDGVPEANLETAAAEGRIEDKGWRVRKDGSRFWADVVITAIRDDDGALRGFMKVTRDMTEQQEYEQQLRQERDLTEQILDTSPTGILVVDSADEITRINYRAQEILDMTAENRTGSVHTTSDFAFVDANGEPLPETEMLFEQVRETGDAVFNIEVGVTQSDGQRVWLSMNVAPLYNDQSAEGTKTVVTLEDITERKQAIDTLDHLNTVSRELMDAEAQTINDRAAALIQAVLDVEYASVWRYDTDSGDFASCTSHTAAEIDQADIRIPEQFEKRAWQTFISNDSDVSNDLPPAADIAAADQPIRSGVIVPLGRHGIACAGSLHPEMFDDTIVDLVETIAANIKAALDRAAREQQLEYQNTELTHLNQVNDIIRAIDQGLVQADTREEIDQLVCERLAASARYEFAWIGEADPTTDAVEPREWVGVDPNYLDAVEITTDDTRTGRGPVGTALRTHEPQVVEDIVTDARFEPWREQTLERAVRSCISVPLCYEDSLYGVLTVYAAQPLNDPRYEVLAELGETIGHAINAVETKRTLQTDSVVELGLHLRKPDTVLATLAQQAACTIEFEGFIPQADDVPTVFFTVHGASSDEIHQLATDSAAVKALAHLSEHEDGRLYKARIGGPTLASSFVEQEAVMRSLTIEEQTVSAIVELSQAADVRTFIDAIQAHFPTTELRTRRTRDRSLAGAQPGQTALEGGLTPRQQEVLRTAYLSGFFESPRDQTGQEIAASLGVSQPTFTQHLRASQRNLLAMLFDETDRT